MTQDSVNNPINERERVCVCVQERRRDRCGMCACIGLIQYIAYIAYEMQDAYYIVKEWKHSISGVP